MDHIVNTSDIISLTATDPLFQMILEKYGPPPDWSRPQGFESLARIILEQQVSLASAEAHFNTLSNYLEEFTAENILRLSEPEMRRCQISRQKSTYLKALSAAILEGKLVLSDLAGLDEVEIRKHLTAVKGIGEWTCDIYLMFCMQTKDIFPAGDIAILNTMKELTALESKEEIMQHAMRWQPLRSLASYFLWHNYLKKKGRPSRQ